MAFTKNRTGFPVLENDIFSYRHTGYRELINDVIKKCLSGNKCFRTGSVFV